MVQRVEQPGRETQIPIHIPALRQNLVYRRNDVALVEKSSPYAIGLPPQRAIYSVKMAPPVAGYTASPVLKHTSNKQ